MSDTIQDAEFTSKQLVRDGFDLGTVQANTPALLVERATAAATSLAAVIDKQKLFSTIQGKRFVRCEGWTTLAAMMGVTPHEVSVEEKDGTFTATVELRRLADASPVGRASAECGIDESTWAKRPRNARRSMALTRATAKACRLAFSWIMALSGYEVTPAEEMHDDEEQPRNRATKPAQAPQEPKTPTEPLKPQKPADDVLYIKMTPAEKLWFWQSAIDKSATLEVLDNQAKRFEGTPFDETTKAYVRNFIAKKRRTLEDEPSGETFRDPADEQSDESLIPF